jgi:hypothetical protein
VFAGAVTGTSGAEVQACSRASWGPVESTSTAVGMAVSEDQFDTATLSGGARVFQPPPVGTNHDPGVDPAREVTLRWQPGTDPSVANGFVWIQPGGGPNCPQYFQVGTTEVFTTTAGTPAGCGARLEKVQTDREPIVIGIYRDAGGGRVETVGIAVFVVTGWFKPSGWSGGPGSSDVPSSLSGIDPCTGGTEFCLYGYFTSKIINADTFNPGGSHFGALSIRTIG